MALIEELNSFLLDPQIREQVFSDEQVASEIEEMMNAVWKREGGTGQESKRLGPHPVFSLSLMSLQCSDVHQQISYYQSGMRCTERESLHHRPDIFL